MTNKERLGIPAVLGICMGGAALCRIVPWAEVQSMRELFWGELGIEIRDKRRASDTAYASPYSDRYGSDRMRLLWSEWFKRSLWRLMWVALAHGQAGVGVIEWDDVLDMVEHWLDIRVHESLEEEKKTRHDLVAELRVFARQCERGGGRVLHLGATSSDIVDNADALRVQGSVNEIRRGLDLLLAVLADRIDMWADVACMGWTHLQLAEVTTVGYRLAQYAQDLLADRDAMEALIIRGKGFKGAVGTAASFERLTGSVESWERMETLALDKLGFLPVWTVSTQTYPRMQDWEVMSRLASLAGSLSRMALDLRLLQSSAIGEMRVDMETGQVGSSAMPFKRNPVGLENINSQARLVIANSRVAWDNATSSMLERTLDDSSNKRTFYPESFLALDHMLSTMTRVVARLHLNHVVIEKRIANHAPFLGVTALLDELVTAGGDRQAYHEHLRQACQGQLDRMAGGGDNLLPELLSVDPAIAGRIPAEQVFDLLDRPVTPGAMPADRARAMARKVRETRGKQPPRDGV